MDKELTLSEMIENAKRQEELRKSDEIEEELNLRITELERREDRREIDRIVRDSKARDEGYFTTVSFQRNSDNS